MGNENIAIIKFEEGWQQEGVGQDGLPLFRPIVKIRKSVPPHTEVDYVATEQDFEDYPLPYQLFLKTQGARKPGVEGYPLALWPVISPAEFQMCVARDIVTVEQLAGITKRNDLPPPILELAKRAKKMVELQGKVGQFEAMITQLTGERDQLAAELKEANATITAQNSMINTLRPKAA